ncbi:tetratricopeptide repeat protein [Candidatus Neomarinimicrobiota bacterium]
MLITVVFIVVYCTPSLNSQKQFIEKTLPANHYAEFRYYDGMVQLYTKGMEDVSEGLRGLHIGNLQIGDSLHHIEKELGEMFDVRSNENGSESRVYHLRTSFKKYPSYLVLTHLEGIVKAIQISGFQTDEPYSFSTIRLGLSKRYLKKVLGPPASVAPVEEITADLWSYEPYPFDFEIIKGVVFSIRVREPDQDESYQKKITFFEEMRNLYQQELFHRVESVCQAKIKEDEKSLEALYFLASVRLYEGLYEDAIPFMELFEKYHQERDSLTSSKTGKQVEGVDARFIGLYYQLGQYHVSNKRYDKAITWLEKSKSSTAINQDPWLYFFLAHSYYHLGDYQKAIKYYKRKIDLEPEEPSSYYNLACCYAAVNNVTEANSWLFHAVEMHNAYKDSALVDPDLDSIRPSEEFQEIIRK